MDNNNTYDYLKMVADEIVFEGLITVTMGDMSWGLDSLKEKYQIDDKDLGQLANILMEDISNVASVYYKTEYNTNDITVYFIPERTQEDLGILSEEGALQKILIEQFVATKKEYEYSYSNWNNELRITANNGDIVYQTKALSETQALKIANDFVFDIAEEKRMKIREEVSKDEEYEI